MSAEQEFKITTKRERALFGLALNELASPKASEALKEAAFLFRGVQRIVRSSKNANDKAFERISDEHPDLNPREVLDRVFDQKSIQVRLLRDRSKKSIYYQCIILLISKWMKAVIKKSHGAIESYADNKYRHETWHDVLLQLGPKFKRGRWAEAIIVASNYVRHFEEWEYDTLERFGPGPKDFRIRRRKFLKTLKGKRARKNVQTLIDVGVKEADLFGPFNWGPLSILETIDSDSAVSLQANCEAWHSEVNKFTSLVVGNHTGNDDSPL